MGAINYDELTDEDWHEIVDICINNKNKSARYDAYLSSATGKKFPLSKTVFLKEIESGITKYLYEISWSRPPFDLSKMDKSRIDYGHLKYHRQIDQYLTPALRKAEVERIMELERKGVAYVPLSKGAYDQISLNKSKPKLNASEIRSVLFMLLYALPLTGALLVPVWLVKGFWKDSIEITETNVNYQSCINYYNQQNVSSIRYSRRDVVPIAEFCREEARSEAGWPTPLISFILSLIILTGIIWYYVAARLKEKEKEWWSN